MKKYIEDYATEIDPDWDDDINSEYENSRAEHDFSTDEDQSGLTKEDIDISELWKRCRRKNNDDFHHDVLPMVQAIEKLQKEAIEGSFKTVGKQDTMVEKDPIKEHIQGIVKFVNSSMYYHTYRGIHHYAGNKNPLQHHIEDRIKNFSWLIRRTPIYYYEMDNCSFLHKPNYTDEDNDKVEGIWVAEDVGEELGLKEKKRKKCDIEKKPKDIPKITPIKCLRMYPRNPDEHPFCKNDLTPKSKQIKEGRTQKVLNFDKAQNNLKNEHTKAMGNQTVQARRTRNITLTKETTTKALSTLGSLVRRKFVYDDCIIPYLIDDNVYQMFDCKAFVGKVECENVLNMNWIDNSVIEIFSAMMFHSPRNHIIGKGVPMFSFIHPSVVYLEMKEGEKRNALIEERAKKIYDRLKKSSKGQFLFMVYNPGNHWVLVVIDVTMKQVFYLDPMHNEPNADLRYLIDSSMSVFAGQDGVQNWSYSSMVKNVQVPQQPGGTKCGYYVLRFIMDIMDNISVLHNNFNGKQVYDQAEINVVRDEWALHITNVIKAASSDTFLPMRARHT